MTDTQAKSIPVSLKVKNIPGAARAASGKTFAFPVLEILYRRKWRPPCSNNITNSGTGCSMFYALLLARIWDGTTL
ncbi:hypothetical protein EV421DRAFT_1833217 [Armillaria borealis]|uniref:Uncharacterized protein n=1 Tax=Armillaria borealis TaxID=47425 RepID=A0AA39J6A1_9AGAR|nr:hypothetical protein EV421DRAFT_1833217 [Armillaria borealis]